MSMDTVPNTAVERAAAAPPPQPGCRVANAVDHSVAGLVRQLREVAGALSDLDLPELHMSLSIQPRDRTLSDTENASVVDAVAVALLGHPASAAGSFHSAHQHRGGLFVTIHAELTEARRGREAVLQAEVDRLRAELARHDTGAES